MKALVVGLGSIGRRHLGNLRSELPQAEITVWRQQARPHEQAAKPPEADRVVYSLEEALTNQPDIAIIANPANLHIRTGLQLAQAGVSLLIEKPLSNSLEDVSELISLCHSGGLTLMVGYNLRFHPALRAMRLAVQNGRIGRVLSVIAEAGQYLPDWRPGSDYSKGVSAQRHLGGGAVLELSHELDYIRWLAGEIEVVNAQMGKISDLEIDVEDSADILLRFAGGASGNVHLDMIQHAPSRTCKLIGSDGTLVWDGIANSVRLYLSSTNRWEALLPAGPLDRNETYLSELRHFLDCVRNGTTPLITGEDGLSVLRIALAALAHCRLSTDSVRIAVGLHENG